MKKLIRCKCGRLYEFFSMTVEDQSMCPQCRAALDEEYAMQEDFDRSRKELDRERLQKVF